ncbi:hypothetical protein [Sutcliffiella rhizosphaerae]|nr:hypothetical protein [Sutcliffiella rhizosphaerae]
MEKLDQTDEIIYPPVCQSMIQTPFHLGQGVFLRQKEGVITLF